jgi:hypothetical protein
MRTVAIAQGCLVVLALAGGFVGCHRSNGANGTGASDKAGGGSSPQPSPPPSAPANATVLPIASIEAFVNPAHLPAYNGPTGGVEGTIHVTGPASPDKQGVDWGSGKCPTARDEYRKLFREGPAFDDGSRALVDAIVAITGYSGYYLPERDEAAKTSIDSCGFRSRTMAMTFGQRLEISNHTSELWAPYLAQQPAPVLMMATSHGDAVKLYPTHPGYFTVGDHNEHPWATLDLYVLLHPLHAVSDEKGHYRIDGIPVGKMKVNARLAAFQRDATADVDIKPGVVQTVDLTLPYVPASPASTADAATPPNQVFNK